MFLREVRIDIEFNGDVLATEWLEPDAERLIDLFPDSPLNWGEKSLHIDIAGIGTLSNVAPSFPKSRHGIVEIDRSEPARLFMMMDDLRPKHEFVSDDDDVVLLMLVDEAPIQELTGTWRMTAAGINDVYEGDFTLPVSYRDWRDPIAKVLDDEDDDRATNSILGESGHEQASARRPVERPTPRVQRESK